MKNILEIGCGQGFRTYLLARNKNNKVIGIDLSEEDIKTAISRYPGVRYEVQNSEKLSFVADSFDEVLAFDIFEHVNNLDAVIAEIKRVLKKGGKLMVNIPYYRSENWLKSIRPTYFDEIHHVRVFGRSELETLLSKQGFSLRKKKREGFLTHIELFYFFKRKRTSHTQLGIGNWRDSLVGMFLHLFLLYFYPVVFQTPLKFFPLWIITIPLGFLIELPGNYLFPKSIYYEFQKNSSR